MTGKFQEFRKSAAVGRKKNPANSRRFLSYFDFLERIIPKFAKKSRAANTERPKVGYRRY
jgi:hypothetical protein